MQEIVPLPHSKDICATVIIPSFPLLIKGEEMMFMCVVSGAGIIRPCAAFVVSSEWSAGDGRTPCPPTAEPMGTAENTYPNKPHKGWPPAFLRAWDYLRSIMINNSKWQRREKL